MIMDTKETINMTYCTTVLYIAVVSVKREKKERQYINHSFILKSKSLFSTLYSTYAVLTYSKRRCRVRGTIL